MPADELADIARAVGMAAERLLFNMIFAGNLPPVHPQMVQILN